MFRICACFSSVILFFVNLFGVIAPQFRPSETSIYNYCPCVMQTEDETVYIYYCTNTESGNITDHIGCRKGARSKTGRIRWGEETIVLTPSDGAWDARHVCDPSAVAGRFVYSGEEYAYLLAYLGCTSDDSQNNEIGLAAAKSPEGPFVKIGGAPFIAFSSDPDYNGFQWGVGQPSLVNLDGSGRIALFYTRGDRDGTRTVCETWDLSNLNAPERLSAETLGTDGLRNLNGEADFLNNADFAFDARENRFVAVSDCHPNPGDAPDYISSSFRVCAFDAAEDFSGIAWETLCTVGKARTFRDRNHNAGLLRDRYGNLPENGGLTVFYTGARKGGDSLWSYRIYAYKVA